MPVTGGIYRQRNWSDVLSQPPGGAVTHKVQADETLTGIAALYGFTLDQMAAANGITDPRDRSWIFAGEYLRLPDSTIGRPSEPRLVPVPNDGKARTMADVKYNSDQRFWGSIQIAGAGGPVGYVVKNGDTLSGIAARFGVEMIRLGNENGIHQEDYGRIFAGEELKLALPYDARRNSQKFVATAVGKALDLGKLQRQDAAGGKTTYVFEHGNVVFGRQAPWNPEKVEVHGVNVMFAGPDQTFAIPREELDMVLRMNPGRLTGAMGDGPGFSFEFQRLSLSGFYSDDGSGGPGEVKYSVSFSANRP